MIVVNKMDVRKKKDKDEDVYVDYVLSKENMVTLLKLNSKND